MHPANRACRCDPTAPEVGLRAACQCRDPVRDDPVRERVEGRFRWIKAAGPPDQIETQFLLYVVCVEARNRARARQTGSAEADIAGNTSVGVGKLLKLLHGFRLRPGGRARGPSTRLRRNFAGTAVGVALTQRKTAEDLESSAVLRCDFS